VPGVFLVGFNHGTGTFIWQTGAQKAGMGKSLSERLAGGPRPYAEAANVLGWDLAKVSFEGPEAELTQTKVCQPALFVHGLALLAALREPGPACRPASRGSPSASAWARSRPMRPRGSSIFPTGLRIVAERGRLMQLACEQTTAAWRRSWARTAPRSASCAANSTSRPPIFNAPGQIHRVGGKDEGGGGRRRRQGARRQEGHRAECRRRLPQPA